MDRTSCQSGRTKEDNGDSQVDTLREEKKSCYQKKYMINTKAPLVFILSIHLLISLKKRISFCPIEKELYSIHT